jgi:hypothetical protein
MADKYAVKADVIVDGHHKAAYVGRSTRLYDPASYVSLVAARMWARRGTAERFISDNADRLPEGTRVVTVSTAPDPA